jgi:phenylacetate-CoA ligase
MSTPASTGLAALQERFSSALAEHLQRHRERPHWDGARLAAHQRDRLRALLARAIAQSPFHAQRLGVIDPECFELADLARLPVMTKDQLMAGFDELATDRRLTRARVEHHLAASAQQPSLLADRFVCLASGGGSGLRGIFVQTIDEYSEFVASFLRPVAAALAAFGGPPPGGVLVGIVGAASPVHASGFGAAAGANGYPVRTVSAPATLPLAELVQRLNAAQPLILQGHTTKLALLAEEKRVGNLRITPVSVTAMGELLTDADRAAISAAFGVPPVNQFTCTEGLAGQSDPGGTVLSFASDMCITELVDENNEPVPDGTPSAKVLVTNLYNQTLPLIRYELTDRFTRHPADPGHGHLRATVEGRADDTLHFGTVAIDPLTIRTVMVRTPAVLEYQVRQTGNGIDVAVVARGQLNRAALTAALKHSLVAAGLPHPHVHVGCVADIQRHPETAKASRFIPS